MGAPEASAVWGETLCGACVTHAAVSFWVTPFWVSTPFRRS